MVVLDVCAALQMAAGTKGGLALQALMSEGGEVMFRKSYQLHFAG